MLEDDRPDVCVVGAGPAGLLLALALARRGQHVVVLEKRATLEPASTRTSGPGPGGAPNLQPVTLGLLDAAGVLDAVRPVSTQIDGAEIQVDGELLAARDYHQVPGVAVPYAMSVPVTALTGALERRVRDESLIRIETGTSVRLRERLGEGFVVQATQGDRQFLVAPRVVVACDGKHSTAREMAGITAETFAFENGYLEVPLPMPAGWGNRMRAHITERGYLLATPVAGPELLLVWIAEPQRINESVSAGPGALAEALAAQAPQLSGILAAASGDLASRTVPHHIVRPRQWARHNLVLVGDSAHGLHAMGGQGLNTALQDALCTAAALDERLRTGDESALREFHAVRRPFIEQFQEQQRHRVAGGHQGVPVFDLDMLALGQPELRDALDAAAAVLGQAATRQWT
ncbi:FAD-dependent oxidoreductase [Salinispora pacifica]|uniref:FAD-dependent oxidoreductase n=1 Tax=Salinispora pacifica TaxID=351187 RepID=UPI00037F45D5|nr:NAD(P)/FAD-dependent oxidoreductase [Salinispora pacifica]